MHNAISPGLRFRTCALKYQFRADQKYARLCSRPLLAPCALPPCWLLLIEILFLFVFFLWLITSWAAEQIGPRRRFLWECIVVSYKHCGAANFHVSYDFGGGGGIAQPLRWLRAWFKYNHKCINLRTIMRRRFRRNTANARGRLRCASHPSLREYDAFTYPQDSFWCTPATQKDSPCPPHLKKKKKKSK